MEKGRDSLGISSYGNPSGHHRIPPHYLDASIRQTAFLTRLIEASLSADFLSSVGLDILWPELGRSPNFLAQSSVSGSGVRLDRVEISSIVRREIFYSFRLRNSSDFSLNPVCKAVCSSRPLCRAYSRSCWVISMEQKRGPHMEQKWAILAPVAGRVSS